jgi:hypothetical protein
MHDPLPASPCHVSPTHPETSAIAIERHPSASNFLENPKSASAAGLFPLARKGDDR